MATQASPRRSFWTWGLQSEEPSDAQRREHAAALSNRFGFEIVPPPIPRAEDLKLRPPRVWPSTSISDICLTDNYERASHSYSSNDQHPAVFGDFPNPPDLVLLSIVSVTIPPRGELVEPPAWCPSTCSG